MFANGDLGAINFDGSVAWTKYLGPVKNSYGFAASLAVWGNSLIIQLDQGEGDSDTPAEGAAPVAAQPGAARRGAAENPPVAGKSRLISLQCATGKVLWQRARPVPASWVTPIVAEAAGKTQIITLGKPWVIGYEQTNGNELWRAELLNNEIVPSPVFANGLVLLLDPGSKLMALRPDGAGEVTKTAVAWAADGNFPDITSPVCSGGLVFTVSSMGMVECLQTADGKQVWETNLDTEVQASPNIAGDRLYVLAKNGDFVMLRAAPERQEIGRIQLPDKFLATPAFAGGRIFIRGATNLFCLGPDDKPAKKP
jgi:outer membrane protein assembly factor BamB